MEIFLYGGDDQFLIKKKIKKTIKKFGKSSRVGQSRGEQKKIIYADEVSRFQDLGFLVGENTFFSKKRIIIIKNIFSKAKTNLKNSFRDFFKAKEYKSFQDFTLIFWEEQKIDKRHGLYKELKKIAIEIIEINENKQGNSSFIKNLVKEKGLKADSEIVFQIQKKLNKMDKNYIDNEIEKLKLLLKYDKRSKIQKADLKILCQNFEEEIWELFSLSLKNKQAAYELLDNLFKQQVPHPVIIGFLASQIRQMIYYYYDRENMNAFMKRKINQIVKYVSKEKLNYYLDKLINLDISIKTSKLDPKFGLMVYISLL